MNLAERAFIVKVSVGIFESVKVDKRTSSRVRSEAGAEADAGRWQASSIPTSAPEYRELSNVRSRIQAVNAFYTSPWMDGGYRIIPSELFHEWKIKVDEAASKLPDAVDALVFAMPRLKRIAIAKANGLWNEDLWPTEAQVRNACWVSREYQPIPQTNDWKLTVGEAEAADIRKEAEESEKAKLEAAQRGAIERLHEAVKHMKDRLRDYSIAENGRLHKSMLTNIEELVGILPYLNVANDPVFSSAIEDCKKYLLAFSSDELKESEGSRNFVMEQADSIFNRLSGIIG